MNTTTNVLTMSNDELKLETALTIRQIISEGIMRPKKLKELFNVSSATIAGWKGEIPERWIGVTSALVVLPVLRKILNKETIENMPTTFKKKRENDEDKIQIVANIVKKPIEIVEKIEKPKAQNLNNQMEIPQISNTVIIKYTAEQLKAIYREKLGGMSENANGRLNEYFGNLEYVKPDDWQIWAYKGIEMTASKKDLSGDPIGYLLGIYKGWLTTNCWGGFSSNHTVQISKKIEERFGVKMSAEATQKMHRLFTMYGTVNMLQSVYDAKMPDTSVIVLDILTKYCEDNGFEKESNE